MSNNEKLIFKITNKTFTINYHFIEPNNIENTSGQYNAYNCTSWIDAINRMNCDIFRKGKFILLILSTKLRIEI